MLQRCLGPGAEQPEELVHDACDLLFLSAPTGSWTDVEVTRMTALSARTEALSQLAAALATGTPSAMRRRLAALMQQQQRLEAAEQAGGVSAGADAAWELLPATQQSQYEAAVPAAAPTSPGPDVLPLPGSSRSEDAQQHQEEEFESEGGLGRGGTGGQAAVDPGSHAARLRRGASSSTLRFVWDVLGASLAAASTMSAYRGRKKPAGHLMMLQ